MQHETLPADIAAAIADYEREVRWSEEYGPCRDGSVASTRATLEATILRHLRGQGEMRDALVDELTGA